MTKKVLEKQTRKYVVASLDLKGNPVYLHSLHDHEWEVTPDIERASKTRSRSLASEVLNNYMTDMHFPDEEWIIVPMVTEMYLIDES